MKIHFSFVSCLIATGAAAVLQSDPPNYYESKFARLQDYCKDKGRVAACCADDKENEEYTPVREGWCEAPYYGDETANKETIENFCKGAVPKCCEGSWKSGKLPTTAACDAVYQSGTEVM